MELQENHVVYERQGPMPCSILGRKLSIDVRKTGARENWSAFKMK